MSESETTVVISRRLGEQIIINPGTPQQITLVVLKVSAGTEARGGRRVQLGVQAAPEIPIRRGETVGGREVTTPTDREGLLRAVCENPDDDLPRLILADWLEDHGGGDRAEWIRHALRYPARQWTCEEDGDVGLFCGDDYGRCQTCADMEADGWPAALLGAGRYLWRRGFVESVSAPLAILEAHLPAITACQPVTAVRATDREPNGAGEGWGASRWWSRADSDDNVESPWWLPRAVFDLLAYDPDLTTHPGVNRSYASDGLAHAALSLALLNKARERAGLPSLTRP